MSPAAQASTGTVRLSARRQETRDKLIDAAAEVFAEVGLQGASVEHVCARAGFTRGAFYSNFSSKEELFLALLDREYTARTHTLRERARVLLPMFQQAANPVSVADAATCIGEFLSHTGSETQWYTLEMEFALLALRDPNGTHGVTDFVSRFNNELSGMVEELIRAAGRRFTLPVERAMPILGGIYDRAFRITAAAGPHAPGGLSELGERMAELLFAITEESPN